MAYTTIDKPTDYFNTKLYTGTGSSQTISGVGFQPDFTWIKIRSGADSHSLEDSVRGANKHLRSDSTLAEVESGTAHITSWNSDGFVLGSGDGQVNGSSSTYASWNWLAGGTASSNTDGSITSTVSANTTAGFSIGTYSANATAGATVGHGLGVAPDMLIVKPRNADNNWVVYHKSMGETKAMYLDGTSAETTDGWMNNTAPSSSVFTLSGGNYGNASGYNVVFYAFAEKKGYSKFGSYSGNGSSDGTYIHLGFRPAFVISKRTDSTENWYMKDNKRSEFNPVDDAVYANSSASELSNWGGATTDYLSNGFKLRTTDTAHNGSGATYIYMAFAENPFVTSTGIPTTAR